MRVSILSLSPVLTNKGTLTCKPVSSFAGLVVLLLVSPLKPGSVSTTESSTNVGGCDSDWTSLEEHDVALGPVEQVVDVVPELLVCQRELFVAPRVHEDPAIPFRVEVLHGSLFGVGTLELLATLEGSVDHGASHHVLDASANERLPLAGLDELVLDHGVRNAIEKHFEALLDV